MTVRLLTAHGAGAVAVLEFRGPRALALVTALCPQIARAPLGVLRRARVELDGESLDDALVWIANQELVELHLHGSTVLVRRLLADVRARGEVDRDSAPPRRALESAAERLLACAENEPAARTLLDQAEGALRRDLELILTLSESAAAPRLARLVAAGLQAAACITPLKVALIGPVNAGKSTLFNALVGARRSIVSAQPGATRDVLSASAWLGHWPVKLLDTAGERDLRSHGAASQLERAGQALGACASAEADWVVRLWPADGSPPPARTDSTPQHEVWIESRADLAVASFEHCEGRVAATVDPHGAVGQLARLFVRCFGLPAAPWAGPAPTPFDLRSRTVVRRAWEAAQRCDPAWRKLLRELLDD